MIVNIPTPVLKALSLLNQAGYTAYLVGGCIRSILLQSNPKDYDITSNAEPEQVMRIFYDCHTVGTGVKHGTVLVVLDGFPLEITTYRIDGTYSDRRRPDHVQFTSRLEEDLARRDFTINAMAWAPDLRKAANDFFQIPQIPPEDIPVRFLAEDVVDPFGGQADLADKRIRCVGSPINRFSEDPLRILRALRFASVLDFSIESDTSAAIDQTRDSLSLVAIERIQVEFSELICGIRAAATIRDQLDVIGVFIPEILSMRGYELLTAHHHLNLLEHTLNVLAQVPPSRTIRLAALLHDIGKPVVFGFDEQGIARFYGHQSAGAAIARDILLRMRFDKLTIERVYQIILHHDAYPETTIRSVRRWLNKHGPDLAHDLLVFKEADILAQHPDSLESRLADLRLIRLIAGQILAEGHCLNLRDLAINGQDLIGLGFKPDRRIGRLLQMLLESVMDDQLHNEKASLIRAARNMLQEELPRQEG